MRKFTLSLVIMVFITTISFAQTTVKGKVTDKNNIALEGVSVVEKGTTKGTTTDRDGNFSLGVSSTNATLVFSGIGLTQTELPLKGGSYVEIAIASSTVDLSGIAVVGTRSLKRSATETPVPVDIIPISKISNSMGQVDLNQILQYVAPSFNSNRQSGADGADHIDPATLRGLGPDQTLVLVNGKRWHQSSLINIYGTRGRGNTGTDLNTIPAASIERIEILRDGAAAQYGSDAIAGVVNIILKSDKGGKINVSTGTNMTGYGSSLDSKEGKVLDNTTDGGTINANVNYGFTLANKGKISVTGDYVHKEKTFRPAYYPLYPDDYRVKFGDASYDNYSLVLNSSIPLEAKTSLYVFGAANHRNGDAYAWTRYPDEERNVIDIYPDGFNPHIVSNITDLALTAGIKTNIKGWASDFYVSGGSNRFEFEVDKTLNASLEAASPTHFDAGGFKLSQNLIGANFSKAFDNIAKGANIAFGAEVRQEQYKIFAGEEASYKQYGPVIFSIDTTYDENDVITSIDTTYRPGGSQGFPGYQPGDETNRTRYSEALFVDGEFDITDKLLIGGAVRIENYSDFGFTTNGKIAARYKFSDHFLLRGSFSTGFRAPSLPQIYYSSTYTNVVAGTIIDQLIAPNDGTLAKEVGIPELKEETSTNLSFGFTAKPINFLTLTVDAYNVNIKDRVILTGTFYSDDDAIGSILESLNVGGAQFFTNAVDTKTWGLDVIASYSHKLGQGRLSETFAANFNDISIEAIHTTEKLKGKEDTYFGPREKAFLLASAPKSKMSLSIDYSLKKFSANVRATNFSGLSLVNWLDDPTDPNSIDKFGDKTVFDLSFSYRITKALSATIGGSNIFDTYPDHHDEGLSESGGMWDAVQMGYGGAFFFARLGFRF